MNDDEQLLFNFMAGYFNEDWPDDGASPSDVVQQYFRDQDSIEELSSVLRALRKLIDGDDLPGELSTRLHEEFGCYFYPPGAGLGTREWLQWVADEFEREIAARGTT
jgi:hypothetical protein